MARARQCGERGAGGRELELQAQAHRFGLGEPHVGPVHAVEPGERLDAVGGPGEHVDDRLQHEGAAAARDRARGPVADARERVGVRVALGQLTHDAREELQHREVGLLQLGAGDTARAAQHPHDGAVRRADRDADVGAEP